MSAFTFSGKEQKPTGDFIFLAQLFRFWQLENIVIAR